MPTQTEIAEHLDLSTRRVRVLLKTLGINSRKSTLDEIRFAYIRDLRNKAAGRGLSTQNELNKARIRELTAKSNLAELELAQKAGQLVPIEEIEPLIASWAVTARSEVHAAIDKIIAGIESKHGIEIDREFIDETTLACFTAIADHPKSFLITTEAQPLSPCMLHNEPEQTQGDGHGKESGSVSERSQSARIHASVW